ncbi:MAG: PHB depolymerase family esterase, partial [Bacteroidota bacterium]
MKKISFFLTSIFIFLLTQTSSAQMNKLETFGPNPGALDGFIHVPEDIAQPRGIVVAMHGCLQDAATYAKETGWNELADRYGFIVLYPQQRAANNANKCFSWYQEGDINKDQGEALSIRNMILYVQEQHQLSEAQLFATGLSAGGAMTAVMMATYPELFDAGAVIAGIPYKATTSLAGAFPAMQGQIDQRPDQWSALVTEQNPDFQGEYPRLVVFHGAADPVVNRQNMVELAEQWTNLHGLETEKVEVIENFEGNEHVTRKNYPKGDPAPKVVTYEVAELGHALAVDPGSGP